MRPDMICPFKFANPNLTHWRCEGKDCMAWKSKTVYDVGETKLIGYCGLVGEP